MIVAIIGKKTKDGIVVTEVIDDKVTDVKLTNISIKKEKLKI